MSIFSRKQKEANPVACGCGGNCNEENMLKNDVTKFKGTSVKVLGSGCAKCSALEAAAKEALTQLGMDTTIEHITDFSQIAAYGVMTTPALVVDGKVACCGRVLKADEIVKLLKKAWGLNDMHRGSVE